MIQLNGKNYLYFILLVIVCLGLLVVFIGCTYSVNLTHLSGESSNTTREDQETDQKTDLSVPFFKW